MSRKTVVKLIGAGLSILVIVTTSIFVLFEYKAQKVYSPKIPDLSFAMKTADIELGKRIYAVRAGCIDCHGEALDGKLVLDDSSMGKVWAPNITPANLKDWKDSEIARAIRYGVGRDGRPLQFMPAMDYVGFSLSDVAAVIGYLRSVKEIPIENRETKFGAPAKILGALGAIPVLFPPEHIDMNQGFANKPEEAPTAEFGKYLAQSCIGCHGIEFKGGKIPGAPPDWPEAANIRLGQNSKWTEDALNSYIDSGLSPTTGQQTRPPMPIELLRQFNVMERKALWSFLGALK